ncbi:M48 family metallopeptidase [Noviherbaspirillum sp.]|uniref:M48 family metallopeptidase n=1 Tax=Noviherbaspirillum sp. TaxID=1926288 RepID=UPI002B45BD55|nr:M48 family metallopeptidase [Noviherbaspirillum sp.]HJV82342.1 M48 family metallopeptidase [Noviherbaspirillum sp.]
MITATYFDGQSARSQAVTLLIHKRIVAIDGDGVRRSYRLSRLDVSERLDHAPRILRLPGGGFIHSSDPGLDRLLRKNGYREPRVVRWQMQWPRSLLALVSLLAVLIAGYQWGLPWAADTLAQQLPEAVWQRIGDEQLTMIDRGFMEPSRLAPEEQERLRQLFAQLKQPRGEKTAYRLEFRRSKMSPNAFALPNGVIIMTDEMVTFAHNDHAVLGVLGHELGHVQRRHSLRHMMQTAGMGVVIHLLIGDVSSVLAAAPAFLLDQKYSRDFEREADGYAIDMMRENHIPLSPMADLFEKLGAAHAHDHGADEVPKRRGQSKTRRDRPLDYLSSHPSDEERIGRLRAADGK